MNTQKRKVHEQNCSLETFTSKQMASDGNMGFCFQFNLPVLHEGSIPKFSPGTSSTPSAPIISSHFASSASAPYAPEGCKDLSYDTSSLSTCYPVGKTQFSVVNPQNSILDLKSSFNLINLHNNQDPRSTENTYQDLYRNLSGSSLFPPIQPFTSQVTRSTSHFQPQKQPAYSPYDMTSGANNSVSLGATIKSKIRVRWTRDLHKRFVESVNRLGGAEKATPKGILREMDVHGLTIFHVKSHLQKYRTARYLPESKEVCVSDAGRLEKTPTIVVTKFDPKIGIHIAKALQLQLDVQRRMHEQLEIQRNLRSQIEEQGRQLKQMLDQQLKTRNTNLGSFRNNSNPIDPSDDFEFKNVLTIKGLQDAH